MAGMIILICDNMDDWITKSRSIIDDDYDIYYSQTNAYYSKGHQASEHNYVSVFVKWNQ